ncbi:helix-turn-helix domain-containing protein [Sphingomonas chungangi]|uniref:helix-turn-helix domain-containing protein n=1 Tax=Sphingomonas chungangi TaxID=2683589 RepID=UPI001FE8FA92|nr:transcriptional regulator [Sphingomonas chungangi]
MEMSLNSAASRLDVPLLSFVKEVSGRRIEEARRSARITQTHLAREVGVSARWLREVEGGNPASKLDDHLRCSRYLRLPTGHILIPLMFLGHEMAFPQQLAFGDFADLERRCIDLIAERNISQITRQLTPHWWPKSDAA